MTSILVIGGQMRRFTATLLILAVSLLVAPSPAHAWFGWLDNLSGPGPFWGGEFDFRMLCLMEQSSLSYEEAIGKLASADGLAMPLIRVLESNTAARRLEPNIGSRISGIFDELKTSTQPLLPTAEKSYGISPEVALDLARHVEGAGNRLKMQHDAIRAGLTPDGEAKFTAAQNSLDRLASSLRAPAVPRVSKFPGSVAFASCSDRSFRGEPTANGQRILRRGDRHQVLSLVMNYREYTNWLHRSGAFAGGETIHFRVIEPKVSWPLSGHFDVLDGQTGIGLYSFSSEGLSGTRVGMIVEPIRFDLHFPSRWSDDPGRNFWSRLVLAFSIRSGLVLFPAGFEPGAFAAKDTVPAGEAARRISGGEAVFEWGIVINVGRLKG